MEYEKTEKIYGTIERTVGRSRGAGRLYVPKDWTGKRVRVELLEEAAGES